MQSCFFRNYAHIRSQSARGIWMVGWSDNVRSFESYSNSIVSHSEMGLFWLHNRLGDKMRQIICKGYRWRREIQRWKLKRDVWTFFSPIGNTSSKCEMLNMFRAPRAHHLSRIWWFWRIAQPNKHREYVWLERQSAQFWVLQKQHGKPFRYGNILIAQ